MVTATVVKNKNEYVSFKCLGHAGFALKGKDIVCSAISVLTINCANSIMSLTETEIDVSEEDGFISWKFIGSVDKHAVLLMDSLLIGLRSIINEYGNKYLTLKVEEV